MVAVLAADPGKLHRTFDHAQGGVAVPVHDPIRERAVIGADPHSAAELFAFEHKWRKGFFEALQFVGVLIVAVLAGRKLLAVGIVAGIDADFFDPLSSFHGGDRNEMDIGDDRGGQSALAECGHNIFEVLRVVNAGGGDAQDFAAGFDDRNGFRHTGGRVHRVGNQHRLDADRIIAAHADGAHLDFAGGAALPLKWIGAVVHGAGGVAGSLVPGTLRAGARCGRNFWTSLNVI